MNEIKITIYQSKQISTKLNYGVKGDKGDKGPQGIQGIQGEKGDKGDTGDTALLTTTETITVGTGGQYATINQALAYATKKYPAYVSASTRPRITISLLSGFVMAEQVIVDGLDLSWITISSVNAEVSITRSALTIANAGGRYPAFTAQNGAFLPIIDTLFNMDTSGSATSRHGIMAFNNSKAIINIGKGFKNAGGAGIHAHQGSTINTYGAIVSGAGTYGIYAEQGSTINATSANASGAGLYCIYANQDSNINAYGAIASGAGNTGIYALEGSTINATSANASYANTYGIYAYRSSTINANSANASYANTCGVYASNASTIEFASGNAQRAGYNTSDVLVNASADGIVASNSSTINAQSSNASNSARYGVSAYSTSRINFGGGTATNTGSYSIYANFNSVISALSSNCSTDGSPSSEYVCSLNSFIDITSATGEVNTEPPLNSYTYAGLITNNTGVITTSGSLPLTGGTLTGLLTTNGQIKFPATQNPSSDPNTLDDYEEGTWTGILTATTPPTTQQTTVGYYTKKGQEVTVTIAFENKNMSGSSGYLAISGLPFSNKYRSFGTFGSIGLTTVPTISTAVGNKLQFYNTNNLGDIYTANANGIYAFATITYITD